MKKEVKRIGLRTNMLTTPNNIGTLGRVKNLNPLISLINTNLKIAI